MARQARATRGSDEGKVKAGTSHTLSGRRYKEATCPERPAPEGHREQGHREQGYCEQGRESDLYFHLLGMIAVYGASLVFVFVL